jgi:succinylarginine dihydrolase
MEANFDGLVGPTHNYAGLAHGNVASLANRRKPANPKAAALQGLEKMRRVAALGIPQAVLPPLARPDLDWLRRLGFAGRDEAIIAKAAKEQPVLLAACYSASSMWTANAATISPSADSADGKVHVTPANLGSQVHRALEPFQTAVLLRRLLPGEAFVNHAPLPADRTFGDEGAANHTRLVPPGAGRGGRERPGVQVFVYGYEALRAGGARESSGPKRFQARQSREASEAVARLHRLDPGRTIFVRQNPAAIDAGVFHNDVIAVGNGPLLFCHEEAFADQAAALREIRRKYASLGAGPLKVIEVKSREVGLRDAVSTYLFNSQVLTLGDGSMLLLAAEECRENAKVRKYLEALVERAQPIRRVEFADLRQSMRNGGGPACLRLRVSLTAEEWAAVPPGVKMDEALYGRLAAWVGRHYRDRLLPKDLADASLLRESRTALEELTGILGLGPVYPFQQ